MPKYLRLAPLVAFSVLAVAGPHAFAQDTKMDKAIDEVLGDHAKYRQVITDFQKAVRSHDAKAAAALVEYPIGVMLNGKKKKISDAKAFIAQYDSIITPAIAAAIQNENYEDLFVNYHGVMLGDGEVWVNGICRGNACKSVDVKVVTIQPGLDRGPPLTPEQLASAEQVQPSKQFKNWAVGCDNLRNCVALGMIPDTEKVGYAYIKVSRGGGASDEASAKVWIDPGSEVKEPTVKLVLDGAELSSGSFNVTADGEYISVLLTSSAAANFARKLRNAKSLKISVLDGSKAVADEEIPLDGSAAALLFLDDTQKRVGTETAMVDKGSKPASSMPPVPAMPMIAAQKITAIGGSKPPVPHGIIRPIDANCDVSFDMVIRLSPTLILWGVCTQMSAYNFDYVFWMVGDGKPKLVEFHVPGRKPDPAKCLSGEILNPMNHL